MIDQSAVVGEGTRSVPASLGAAQTARRRVQLGEHRVGGARGVPGEARHGVLARHEAGVARDDRDGGPAAEEEEAVVARVRLRASHDFPAQDQVVDREALEEDRRADLCGNDTVTKRHDSVTRRVDSESAPCLP